MTLSSEESKKLWENIFCFKKLVIFLNYNLSRIILTKIFMSCSFLFILKTKITSKKWNLCRQNWNLTLTKLWFFSFVAKMSKWWFFFCLYLYAKKFDFFSLKGFCVNICANWEVWRGLLNDSWKNASRSNE